MLIGNDFVFIENPKTASTSIQEALSKKAVKAFNRHDNMFNDVVIPRKRHRLYVVRNPWDRMVSGFHSNAITDTKHQRLKERFTEWLTGPTWDVGAGTDFKRTSQLFWGWKTNRLIRFENLEEDFERFCKMLNIKTELKHRNPSKDRIDYQDYYNQQSIDIVADRFATDIKTYGYTFK